MTGLERWLFRLLPRVTRERDLAVRQLGKALAREQALRIENEMLHRELERYGGFWKDYPEGVPLDPNEEPPEQYRA